MDIPMDMEISNQFPIGFREVIPNQFMSDQCAEFVVSIGDAQGTLQDVELPDAAGGYSYKHLQHNDLRRNRFISWRSSNDTLELCETSLDVNLISNKVRFRFKDNPILSGGVSIYETQHNIIVLVATARSVHKLTFKRPSNLNEFGHKSSMMDFTTTDKIGPSNDEDTYSVFASASPATAKENFYPLRASGTSPLPRIASTYLMDNGDSMFALANSSGSIMLIKLGNMFCMGSTSQLKTSSYLGRLWENLGGSSSVVCMTSLEFDVIQDEVYILGVCKSHKLRVWSTATYDCVMEMALDENEIFHHKFRSEPFSNSTVSAQSHQGVQNHMLKKILPLHAKISESEASLDEWPSFVVFLCFSGSSMFYFFRLVNIAGKISVEATASFPAPSSCDLVDFHASCSMLNTSDACICLWTIWTYGTSDQLSLQYVLVPIEGESTNYIWNNVTLENSKTTMTEDLSSSLNTRQNFLKQIFYPGRFSNKILLKTLSIYRRNLAVDFLANCSNDFDKLRENICRAVEAEIREQVDDAFEVTDTEYMSVCYAAWLRFYTCALEYNVFELRPLGLLVDPDITSGLIVVIKHNGDCSFIRPVDGLEAVINEEDFSNFRLQALHGENILVDDSDLAAGLILLIRAAGQVGRMLQEMDNAGQIFEDCLRGFADPEVVASSVAAKLVAERDTNELKALMSKLDDVMIDFDHIMECLLSMLELERGIVSSITYDDLVGQGSTNQAEGPLPFASKFGISIITESLKQMCSARLYLSCNVIFLQLLMLEVGCFSSRDLPIETCSAAGSLSHLIHSKFLPRYIVMAHCYYIIKWTSETIATAPPPNSMERNLNQMSIMHISDSIRHEYQRMAVHLPSTGSRPITLAELFFSSFGMRGHGSLLASTGCHSPWWSLLTPLVNISAQLLWPRCGHPILQDFLLGSCQYAQIQDYVRLLRRWCHWNCESRTFLLGCALLNTGEPEKAVDCFIRASKGVVVDEFLYRMLFSDRGRNDKSTASALEVTYFMRVVQLLKQFSYPDFVVNVAQIALDKCDHTETDNRAAICYILFLYNLRLGHNDAAYGYMMDNPDVMQKKDSLRQFVVTLFERRQLRQLTSYSFDEMLEDIDQIVQTRARSVDLTHNNYYHFLYSFYVVRKNYRKAACVMYECGMRLATEQYNKEGLRRQIKCYLTCINTLKLANPNYAWIVKPTLEARTVMSFDDSIRSPKRNFDGDLKLPNEDSDVVKVLQVLELSDIRREMDLITIRLKLVNKKADPTQPMMTIGLSPLETVSLCISANLYEDALLLCSSFGLDHAPVFQGLASRCVHLTRCASKPIEIESAWNWLADNNVGNTGQNWTHNAVETAWILLERILKRLEVPGQTILHKSVADRLLTLNAPLPMWLVKFYHKSFGAELLRLYLKHGLLESASELVVNLISANLGQSKGLFGVQESLYAGSKPAWLPYYSIHTLLKELKSNMQQHSILEKCYQEVNEKLDNYVKIVTRVSHDMVRFRSKAANA